MNPNREFQREKLQQSVENARTTVAEQQLNAEQEEQDAAALELELREAEAAAQKQDEAEEKGKETERQLGEVAGA